MTNRCCRRRSWRRTEKCQ